MKLAIITLTENGRELAQELSLKLEEDPTVIQIDLYHKNVKQTLNTIFQEYDCILGIMATGIMVRSICSLIEDKNRDPAVLVMDERGIHVISLLSGHLGGGNDFTIKIANVLNTESVITTATDVNGKIGIDSLACKYYMEINSTYKVLDINKALVNNQKVILAVPEKYSYLFEDKLIKNSYEIAKSSGMLEARFNDSIITLTPKRLVVGVGSRKGVSADQVLSAVDEACSFLGIPPKRIDCLATAEPKKNEQGIKDTAERLGVPLEVVTLEELKEFSHPDVTESAFVSEIFGVPGICEPTALYVAGEHAKLVLRKTKINKVTVAAAISLV
jgi:cobalt-precorrin 5A hydrolase